MSLCENLLRFRSQSLQVLDDAGTPLIYFDLLDGYSEPVRVKGKDWDVPGAAGRVWMPKEADSRLIELDGFVRGVGATLAERQQSWRTSTDIVAAVFSLLLPMGTLEVAAPYLGLSVDASISATAVQVMSGAPQSLMTYQRWNVKLEAFDPDWAVES